MTQLTATTQPIEQKRKLYMNTVKTVNIPQLEKKKKKFCFQRNAS